MLPSRSHKSTIHVLIPTLALLRGEMLPPPPPKTTIRDSSTTVRHHRWAILDTIMPIPSPCLRQIRGLLSLPAQVTPGVMPSRIPLAPNHRHTYETHTLAITVRRLTIPSVYVATGRITERPLHAIRVESQATKPNTMLDTRHLRLPLLVRDRSPATGVPAMLVHRVSRNQTRGMLTLIIIGILF